jgi:hypothetical protein
MMRNITIAIHSTSIWKRNDSLPDNVVEWLSFHGLKISNKYTREGIRSHHHLDCDTATWITYFTIENINEMDETAFRLMFSEYHITRSRSIRIAYPHPATWGRHYILPPVLAEWTYVRGLVCRYNGIGKRNDVPDAWRSYFIIENIEEVDEVAFRLTFSDYEITEFES